MQLSCNPIKKQSKEFIKLWSPKTKHKSSRETFIKNWIKKNEKMNLKPFLCQLNSTKVKTLKEPTLTAFLVLIAAAVEIISDWANFMAGLMGTLPNNH